MVLVRFTKGSSKFSFCLMFCFCLMFLLNALLFSLIHTPSHEILIIKYHSSSTSSSSIPNVGEEGSGKNHVQCWITSPNKRDQFLQFFLQKQEMRYLLIKKSISSYNTVTTASFSISGKLWALWALSTQKPPPFLVSAVKMRDSTARSQQLYCTLFHTWINKRSLATHGTGGHTLYMQIRMTFVAGE